MRDAPDGVFDVVVVGDEVESVITAVSAARVGSRVALVRPLARGWLGGLSTRGGLCYMDITPGYQGPLFAEFLRRAQVRRIALHAPTAHDTLMAMLAECDARLFTGDAPRARWRPDAGRWRLNLGAGQTLTTRFLIDATPDADVTRGLGAAYVEGLGGLFGPDWNFLGVTPVFQTTGVDRDGLMAFEESLRTSAQAADWLAKGLPHLSEAQREELLRRPVFSPPDEDYIDVLNPLIGVAFHVWRGGGADDYPQAEIAIDGFNIARLPDGALGFNGMVMRGRSLTDLIGWSRAETAWPQALRDALGDFERFLREAGGFSQARVLAPQALYVRQTVNVLGRETLTAAQALSGGVTPEEAIGTYSYWLDLRGVVLARHYPGETLDKPVFNVGLNPCIPVLPGGRASGEGRLALIGRAAGYSPLGQGAGRIIQHNAMAGEAMGAAAALAAQRKTALDEVTPADVRAILRTRADIAITGEAVRPPHAIAASALLQADIAIATRLRSGLA